MVLWDPVYSRGGCSYLRLVFAGRFLYGISKKIELQFQIKIIGTFIELFRIKRIKKDMPGV